MRPAIRPLRIVLAFCLLILIPQYVPGYAWSMEGQGFSLGSLLQDGFAWPVFLAFAVGGLLGGGARGLLRGLAYLFGAAAGKSDEHRAAAHGALLGASRGLLWGSCLMLTFCFVQVYARAFGTQEPLGPEPWSAYQERMNFIRMGGYLVLPMLLLVLWPALSGLGARLVRVQPWLRKSDYVAVGFYGSLAFVVPLSLLVARTGIIGEPNSARYAMAPTGSSLDVAFALWSLVAVLVLSALALGLGGLRNLGRAQAGHSFSDLLILGAGMMASTLVRVAGMQAIALGGGSGNPAELQAMGGRMLLPVVVACALILARRSILGMGAPSPEEHAALSR